MTTIAYRNGVVATDTKAMWGPYALQGSALKLRQDPDGRFIIAMCGEAGTGAPLMEFLHRHLLQHPGALQADTVDNIGLLAECPKAGSETTVIVIGVVDGRARCWMFEHAGPFSLLLRDFDAWGSGQPIALGAMFAGADAVKAVQACWAYDPATGGEIITARLKGIEDPDH